MGRTLSTFSNTSLFLFLLRTFISSLAHLLFGFGFLLFHLCSSIKVQNAHDFWFHPHPEFSVCVLGFLLHFAFVWFSLQGWQFSPEPHTHQASTLPLSSISSLCFRWFVFWCLVLFCFRAGFLCTALDVLELCSVAQAEFELTEIRLPQPPRAGMKGFVSVFKTRSH